jgi:ABC-type amino acid transport system permease subunit
MFGYTFQWKQALSKLPQMLDGALVTMEIALLSMAIGIALAVLLTLFRLSGNRVPERLCRPPGSRSRATRRRCSRSIWRISGLPAFGIHLSPFTSLLIGITFNNAGYLAENFRGALKAIPETQTRAGRSLGMTPLQAFGYIVMPQMLRIAFLPMTNQMVWAILMTSLGVTVGLNIDLYGVTQDLNALTFRTFELFAIAAVIFYLITKIIQLGARLVAARLFRY